MDRHVIETLGKIRVIVEGGKVVNVEEPNLKLEYCPLVDQIFGSEKITPEIAKQSIEHRIEWFGFCTKDRKIKSENYRVDFGTSEIASCALRSGIFDAFVEPCDGAGTIITDAPEIAQGIGEVMSGLTETSPVPEVMHNLEREGCIVVDPVNASIDQKRGVETALDAGYKKIGVSVVSLSEAERCRGVEKEKNGVCYLLGVHITGMKAEEAEKFLKMVDITSSGASKEIRKIASKYAILQFGTRIPAFAMTDKGREIALNRLKYIEKPLLIKVSEIPELSENDQPRPLF